MLCRRPGNPAGGFFFAGEVADFRRFRPCASACFRYLPLRFATARLDSTSPA